MIAEINSTIEVLKPSVLLYDWFTTPLEDLCLTCHDINVEVNTFACLPKYWYFLLFLVLLLVVICIILKRAKW